SGTAAMSILGIARSLPQSWHACMSIESARSRCSCGERYSPAGTVFAYWQFTTVGHAMMPLGSQPLAQASRPRAPPTVGVRCSASLDSSRIDSRVSFSFLMGFMDFLLSIGDTPAEQVAHAAVQCRWERSGYATVASARG